MKIIEVDEYDIVNQRTGLNFVCGVAFLRSSEFHDWGDAWEFSQVVSSILGPTKELVPNRHDKCRLGAPEMQQARWTRYYPYDRDKTVYFLNKEDMDKSIAMFLLKN